MLPALIHPISVSCSRRTRPTSVIAGEDRCALLHPARSLDFWSLRSRDSLRLYREVPFSTRIIHDLGFSAVLLRNGVVEHRIVLIIRVCNSANCAKVLAITCTTTTPLASITCSNLKGGRREQCPGCDLRCVHDAALGAGERISAARPAQLSSAPPPDSAPGASVPYPAVNAAAGRSRSSGRLGISRIILRSGRIQRFAHRGRQVERRWEQVQALVLACCCAFKDLGAC